MNRIKVLALVEFVAVLIALVTPITPSRTGSTTRPGDWFVADATYLDHVVASFVFLHLVAGVLVVLLGGVVWVQSRREGATERSEVRSGPHTKEEE